MQHSRKTTLDVRLSFLICTLLVLSPTDNFFRKLNLKTDILWGIQEQDYILKNLDEFYSVLNQVHIRRFSYILLRPILFTFLPSPNTPKVEIDVEDIMLLKKYLKS